MSTTAVVRLDDLGYLDYVEVFVDSGFANVAGSWKRARFIQKSRRYPGSAQVDIDGTRAYVGPDRVRAVSPAASSEAQLAKHARVGNSLLVSIAESASPDLRAQADQAHIDKLARVSGQAVAVLRRSGAHLDP